MTAKIIDGTAIAKEVRAEVKEKVAKRVAAGKPQPGLATVLVGERVDSATYVRMKQKACADLGMNSFHRPMPIDATQEEVEALVSELNADPAVNGILVQLPLPDHLDEEKVLQAIDLEKDVDGFHPINIGRLAQKGREPVFVPCTPYGCIYLLKKAGVELSGANAVVLGRSNIVGMPAALLLVKENATVTVVHSRTKNIEDVVRNADIIIAAIGMMEFVKGDWVKPGAAIIDVGINEKPDDTKKRGYRLVGDVNYEEAAEVADYITPVPGGVGPMTIAMLMANTLRAAEIQQD
ncbi:MAG: bifunctional methylenetetrahydrofolate dehydrogenase/methenyltetrahydrofolate cyclohydrolase FolD [Chloroflexi bacterium]|nr:bifunctional methylenetetrahydrofolate dehydrogenase/methenyltetrahydrofolate cyclohydrolase FolD [Chloroflexota bacterium]